MLSYDFVEDGMIRFVEDGMIRFVEDGMIRFVEDGMIRPRFLKSVLSARLTRFPIALALIGSLSVGVCQAHPYPFPGDINEDDPLTPNDAVLALRIAFGLMNPTPLQKRTADVDVNGVVDIADARLILRFATNVEQFLINELHPFWPDNSETLSGLSRSSSLVILGRVTRFLPSKMVLTPAIPENPIQTEFAVQSVEVEVVRALRSPAGEMVQAGDRLDVRAPGGFIRQPLPSHGGKVLTLTEVCEDCPAFEDGESVLLFLRPGTFLRSPSEEQGGWEVTNWGLGKWTEVSEGRYRRENFREPTSIFLSDVTAALEQNPFVPG
jgi:hypothetical protein